MTERPTDAGHLARVGDISMYYEIHGTGTPLVLIGGLGADLTMLRGKGTNSLSATRC